MLIIGSPLLRITRELMCGNVDLGPAARCRIMVKIGMVCFDHLTESPLEGLSVRAGVHAQEIVEHGPTVPTDPVTLAELQAHCRHRPWRTSRDPARESVSHRPASSLQPPDQAAYGGWSPPEVHPGRTRRAILDASRKARAHRRCRPIS